MLSGYLILNKPSGFSSHTAVAKLRKLLGEKKIGHGGTLDPMASGVLPLFVGRATRAAGMLLDSDKAYIAGFVTGFSSDSYDITGKPTTCTSIHAGAAEIIPLLSKFTGRRAQLPPMYSAIKVDGQKLYELARRGIEIEREAREITLYAVDYLGSRAITELSDFGGVPFLPVSDAISAFYPGHTVTTEHFIRVSCSKGTYIRSLIHDIGQALGCGAVLTSLCRSLAGEFDISEAISLEQAASIVSEKGAEALLRPVDTLFSDLPALTLTAEEEKRCRNGAVVYLSQPITEGDYRVYSEAGVFLMIGRAYACTGETGLTSVKNFFDSN